MNGVTPWLPLSTLALAQAQLQKATAEGKGDLFKLRDYTVRKNSRSDDRSSSLPRRFTRAPLRCHSLIKRLVVKDVTFAAFANSSFVRLSAIPPELSLHSCGQ